jgi:hypothetical protein
LACLAPRQSAEPTAAGAIVYFSRHFLITAVFPPFLQQLLSCHFLAAVLLPLFSSRSFPAFSSCPHPFFLACHREILLHCYPLCKSGLIHFVTSILNVAGPKSFFYPLLGLRKIKWPLGLHRF